MLAFICVQLHHPDLFPVQVFVALKPATVSRRAFCGGHPRLLGKSKGRGQRGKRKPCFQQPASPGGPRARLEADEKQGGRLGLGRFCVSAPQPAGCWGAFSSLPDFFYHRTGCHQTPEELGRAAGVCTHATPPDDAADARGAGTATWPCQLLSGCCEHPGPLSGFKK